MTDRQPGDQRRTHACPACGGTVECGMTNGDPACWCSSLPHVLPVADTGDARCYCRECLQALIAARSQRLLQ
jgi:Cysteine-rich CWC